MVNRETGLVGVMEIIFREEKEQPGPATIEVRAGDQDGTANRAAGVLKTIPGFWLPGSVIEPLIGVELLMPPVVIETPVETAGPTPDGDVYQPAIARPVLGRVVPNLQLDFAYGIHAWRRIATGSGSTAQPVADPVYC